MALIYRHYPGMEVLSCTDGFAFKPHIHDRYVVWLNTGCGEHYSVKGETGILQPGAISIFEPGLVHANHPCKGGKRHLRSFYVDPQFFDDLAGEYGRNRFHGFKNQTITDPELWQGLAGLHQESISSPDKKMAASLAVETFISLLARHGGLGRAERRADRCDHRVKKAISYFRANLDREIGLKELAATLGCTRFHLIRLFKAHKGISPHALLLQMRLEHARNLIENGRPISDSALESGFSDQSHLTRAFKSRYGLTPAAYQRVK